MLISRPDNPSMPLNEITTEELEKTLDLIKSLPHYIIVAKENDVPTKFKEWRKYRGFTLRHVELETGISNAYLSQLESGKFAKPSFEVVSKLCKVYSIRLIIN